MSETLKMQTRDFAEENAKKLMELFPNVVTETVDIHGNVIRAIDKDKLEQEINTAVVAGPQQRYEFSWPDKRKAAAEAGRPINKTLRPCREESVDFDNTENLYIEGDNLEVLKLLQETYLGKVKMIYIDPPYNTGHDFVYNDYTVQEKEDYLNNSGQYDEEGNYIANNPLPETDGRFHTKWLNMMYPRLRLAKNLLTDDGVIFISIDDNEVENLRKICDEVFGESNFIAEFVWQKKSSGGQHANYVLDFHEYIFLYARNMNLVKEINVKRTDKQLKSFTEEDEYLGERGKYLLSPLKSWLDYRKTLIYDIVCPDGTSINTQWVCSRETFFQLQKEGRIVFKENSSGEWTIYKKQYSMEGGGRVKPASLIVEHGQTANGKREIKTLFGEDIFSFPKPVELLKYLVSMNNDSNSLVLDFFSGSATTAHAVMQLNAEDGGHRKFIMVQLPEKCDEKSEAFKAGYKNICEIGKERIRRAAKKIKEETGKDIDYGFRVLKADSSNMKDVYYTPNKIGQTSLVADNIKQDRSSEDLLFQVMLELGIPLSAKITKEDVAGKEVFNVNEGFLVACFDDNLGDETVTAVAKKKPLYFVACDRSIATDDVFTNIEQIFNHYSPETVRRVL